MTAAQAAVMQSRRYALHTRVEVENVDGTWIDLSDVDGRDWVKRWSISQNVDRSVFDARVALIRSRADGRSLVPFVEGSVLNVDDAGAYSPLLDPGRGIRIYAAAIAPGLTPVSADWLEMLNGVQDRVEWPASPIQVAARGALGADAQDRTIEEETEYGEAGGTDVEDLMQLILDDWTDIGTLFAPSSPGFAVTTTPFGGVQVLDALLRLAALLGYVVREEWDDGTSAFRLTFKEPDRAPASTDWTFGPGDYFEVSLIAVDIEAVRNVVRVNYIDAAGEIQHYQTEDAASIARFRRRYYEINEGADSPINTAAEAQALGDAALSDLALPIAEFEIRARFFPFAQLDDFYEFLPADNLFDVARDFAVTGFRHEFGDAQAFTYLQLRERPAGFGRLWGTLPGVHRDLADIVQVSSTVFATLWPTSDQTTGGFAASAPLWSKLDNVGTGEPSDATFVETDNPHITECPTLDADDAFEVHLDDAPGTPGSEQTVRLRVRAQRVEGGGGGSMEMDIELYEGATQRASRTSIDLGTSFESHDLYLSSAQISSITDWTDLRCRVTVRGCVITAPSDTVDARVSQISLSLS